MVERQERLPARTEVDEVAAGIARIQLPIMIPGLGHVNCYVLEDERGVTLIDPGLPDPETAQALMARLASVGIRPEQVHTVVVTHSHPDHFGGAGRLKVEHGSDVLAHRQFHTPFDARPEEVLNELLFGEGSTPELPPLSTPWGEDGFKLEAAELEVMRGWDDLSKQGLLRLAPTIRVEDLDVIRLGGREWQGLHTPGHTGDHICLLDPADGTFLSGDHVLPTITPHISGLTGSTDALAEFVDALRRVASIPGVTNVLPAHGLPFDDLAGRVDDIISHHVERLAQIELIGAELDDGTVRQYARRLFQERSWGPMAESETYAHLEHLRIQGRMRRHTDDDGLTRFAPTPTPA